MVTLLFGGGYFYYIAQAVCPVPIAYSIGEIDERFDLNEDEARVIISEAESVWEDATGRNLFSYEEDGELVINFVFDNRQKFIEAEDQLKEKLDATENVSDELQNTYASLVSEYNELRVSYATKVEIYEKRLQRYNAEVEKYNEQGGAPADVYEALSKEKEALDAEQSSINSLSSKLNVLVEEINSIGEKGNSLIDTYNEGVGVYNKTFGEPREFTQGDYVNGTITIYTFEDAEELKLVLVHELGHALSLGHVEGKESAMYYLIGEQPEELVLSAEDIGEFDRVCGEKSIFQKAAMFIRPN